MFVSREPEQQGAASSGPRLSAVPLAYGLADTAKEIDLGEGAASAEATAGTQRPPLVRQTIEVQRGDSLLSLFDMHSVSPSTVLAAISRLHPRLNPKRIKAGDRVSFVLNTNEDRVTIEEMTVARIGKRVRRQHWAGRTFEPGDVV
ncbi:MAG: hypothetical protein OXQ29_03555, partial [Rhodospirillaceae bacterium]|nr:hypothetical protein [Rhodospirillaceae bacterium]